MPRSSSPADDQIPDTALFAEYQPFTNRFDEAFTGDGEARLHWQAFQSSFSALPDLEQKQRFERLRRLVLENGIAHDLFADENLRQPWSIDLFPLIISAREWEFLERGLTQQARLFDRIAKDIYGAQTLARTGRIPPRLIFSDASLLRACRPAKDDAHLINFFAADLIRDAAGNWRIVDVHAETPAGVGFALANRLVHGQISGDLFRRTGAVRLAPYFQKLQLELLQRIEKDDPLVVLLTPGPRHEDYFGHAYLSRYLGFQLVEGGDLRVIGSRVYMKTLEGLKPIDLMIRCVEGAKCDPLELDPNGFLGPVGLVQALRKNQRLVVNFLGSAVVENRALGPCLPAICRDWLGEDLVLDTVPRRWMGDMEARVFVFAHPDRFVIRKAQEGTGRPGRADQGILPDQLTGRDLEALKFELEVNGQDYVAEERMICATAPSWTPEGVKARPFAVRLYVLALDGDYRVMPGGLAMSLDGTPGVAMSAVDGHSRDVWVLSDRDASSTLSLLRPPAEVAQILRSGKGLRSRIADNLFWMGRYTERADWVLRILRAAVARVDETNLAFTTTAGPQAIDVLLSKTPLASRLDFPGETGPVEMAARLLMTSHRIPYAVPSVVGNILQVGSIVRDRLSLELWQTLQRISEVATPDAAEIEDSDDLADRINTAIIEIAALNGLTAENMTRNYGWHFLDMGRRLERAYNLAELMLKLFGEAKRSDEETARLFFVLNVADSIITFRQRYLFAPVLSLVLDLLLVDETNPRSIGFQLSMVSSHLAAMPLASQHAPQSDEQRMILDLMTRVRLATVTALAQPDAQGQRAEFKSLFTHLITELPRLSEAITRRYFNLTEDELRRVYTRLGRG
jgi:uncharacterized circularly permuted ATP-grasp superfamily protein/uncharacterized alpha-E superfamily protein